MEMEKDILSMIDQLYVMIDEAKSVIMTSDKCMIVRDDALDLLEEIKESYPKAFQQAQNVLTHRDTILAEAKRRAAEITREAEQDARTKLNESEHIRAVQSKALEVQRSAQKEAEEIIRRAEEHAASVKNAANAYTDDTLRRAEEALQQAYSELEDSRLRFRSTVAAPRGKGEPNFSEDN